MPDILIRGCNDHLLNVLRNNTDCEVLVLPPHGDLKDARQICEEIDDIWDGRPLAPIGAKVLSIIDSAPAIVPADKEDT